DALPILAAVSLKAGVPGGALAVFAVCLFGGVRIKGGHGGRQLLRIYACVAGQLFYRSAFDKVARFDVLVGGEGKRLHVAEPVPLQRPMVAYQEQAVMVV